MIIKTSPFVPVISLLTVSGILLTYLFGITSASSGLSLEHVLFSVVLVLLIAAGVLIKKVFIDLEKAATRAGENERRLSQIVESIPNGLIMVDARGRIVLVNKMAEELFGYARQELLQQSIEKLVPADLRQQHTRQREAYLRKPETRRMGEGRDLYGVRKDGTRLPVEIGLSRVDSKEGHFVVAAIADITERKSGQEHLQRLTEELKRSNEELEQFAYVASHDLQEPLRMVASYTQLLAKRYRYTLDSEAREYIQFAVEGASRMQRLINDLLTFSRVGRHGKAFAPVDCGHICQEIIKNFKFVVEESKAQITVEPLPTVMADDTQMFQLFQNLIGNAIKFRSDQPPEIRIAAEAKGKYWEFSVRDNGIGMERRHSQRVFVIFERLHTRERYEGTGIGLAVAKKIVERHGGRIWLSSQEGSGTTVFFTIPRKEPTDHG